MLSSLFRGRGRGRGTPLISGLPMYVFRLRMLLCVCINYGEKKYAYVLYVFMLMYFIMFTRRSMARASGLPISALLCMFLYQCMFLKLIDCSCITIVISCLFICL